MSGRKEVRLADVNTKSMETIDIETVQSFDDVKYCGHNA